MAEQHSKITHSILYTSTFRCQNLKPNSTLWHLWKVSAFLDCQLVLGQILQCTSESTMCLHLCKWIQCSIAETKTVYSLMSQSSAMGGFLHTFLCLPLEHTLSINEILHECDLKSIENSKVLCILAPVKKPKRASQEFSQYMPLHYSSVMFILHPKLLKSKLPFLSIHIFSSKNFFKNMSAKTKGVELARIHATSKGLLGKPYVHAIYLDWQ